MFLEKTVNSKCYFGHLATAIKVLSISILFVSFKTLHICNTRVDNLTFDINTNEKKKKKIICN